MSEWQPIESAPKDGTYIDVWYAPKSPEGEPLVPCRVAYAWFEDDRWWYQNTSNGLRLRLWQEPTHWMPLPGPPSQERDHGHPLSGDNLIIRGNRRENVGYRSRRREKRNNALARQLLADAFAAEGLTDQEEWVRTNGGGHGCGYSAALAAIKRALSIYPSKEEVDG